MWRPHGKHLVLIACGLLLLVGAGAALVLHQKSENRKNTPEARAERLYQSLGAEVNIPMYMANKPTEYHFKTAQAEDSAIVISIYDTSKGVINVTQQPKPAADPFGTTKPVDSYVTSVGQARLFPDSERNPYVVVETPLTWIIVRSTSDRILSSDLKSFCLSLKEVTTK